MTVENLSEEAAKRFDPSIKLQMDELTKHLETRQERATSTSMSEITRDEIDAKIAASEARTDTKFERLMGRLDAIEKSTAGIKSTVIATGIGAVAIAIAAFAYGGQMFGIGLDSQAIANSAATAVEGRLNQRLEGLEVQLGNLISAIEAE